MRYIVLDSILIILINILGYLMKVKVPKIAYDYPSMLIGIRRNFHFFNHQDHQAIGVPQFRETSIV